MATFLEDMNAAFAEQSANSTAKFAALTDTITQKFTDLTALTNSIDQGVEDLFAQIDALSKSNLTAAQQADLLAAATATKTELDANITKVTDALSANIDAVRTAENKILTQDNAPGGAAAAKAAPGAAKPTSSAPKA